jgi:hypothetical protein
VLTTDVNIQIDTHALLNYCARDKDAIPRLNCSEPAHPCTLAESSQYKKRVLVGCDKRPECSVNCVPADELIIAPCLRILGVVKLIFEEGV